MGDFTLTLQRLQAVGITLDSVARQMGIGKAYLRQIVRGHQPVRPTTEAKLREAIRKLADKQRKRKSHSSTHEEYLTALADYLESLA